LSNKRNKSNTPAAKSTNATRPRLQRGRARYSLTAISPAHYQGFVASAKYDLPDNFIPVLKAELPVCFLKNLNLFFA
jgi:hypothetical protein